MASSSSSSSSDEISTLGEKDPSYTKEITSLGYYLSHYDFSLNLERYSRWDTDTAQKEMLEKPEMISVVKYLHEVVGYDLGQNHFTSWDPNSKNYIMLGPTVVCMANFLHRSGWNFNHIAAHQHLKAGLTPPHRRQFSSFATAYSQVRVRGDQPPPPGANASQLQIDIHTASEQLIQSLTSTRISPLQFSIDTAYERLLPSKRRIHKVSQQLRMSTRQHSKPSVYDPIMVSLGPYHHGKEQFHQAEEFKHLCLEWFTNGSDEHKGYLYDRVRSNINKIRACYADTSTVNKYDDDALAVMMVMDACFIINFIRIRTSDVIAKDSYNCLGVAAALPFAARDMMVLENQIPYFVLKLLIAAMGSTEEVVLGEFLSELMSMELECARIPREANDPPLHLLEACRRILVEDGLADDLEATNTRFWIGTNKRSTRASEENASYASKQKTSYHTTSPVSYLKAKGVRFLPSSSHYLKDIKFTSHALYGELKLPVCYVSNLTTVFLSNMIAYEVSPDNVTTSPDLTVLSYTNFMKSLIQTPADVMELQRKGILCINRLGNQAEVVELFKSIETFNLRNVSIYQDVMLRLGEHSNNKAKTWMADLIHSKLNSPWTIIALFSATILLVLTFLQTFYTIRPVQ